MEKKTIKVLVVDDSLLFRESISRRLREDPEIDVVATARDPYEARNMILEYRPDVMTLDIEMPKMNGIDFLKRLIPQYPIPTIVISATDGRAFDAINAGAVEIVSKPSSNMDLDDFVKELSKKIKIASIAKVRYHKRIHNYEKKLEDSNNTDTPMSAHSDKILAIGASTGGTNAIYDILKEFESKAIPGIVIVQHMPPVFTALYAERLNKNCVLDVKEAEDGDEIMPGKVFIAPGGYHMTVEKRGNRYFVRTQKGTEEDKVNGHCPSVDVLFHSIAKEVGEKAIGVILTGMGKDGAQGLLAMRNKGASTIGQNEETSIVYGMPKVAYEIGAVEKQLPLGKIARELIEKTQ